MIHTRSDLYYHFPKLAMITIIAIAIISVVSASHALQTGLVATAETEQYHNCITNIERDPMIALNNAETWIRQSRSPAAYHCRAMSEFKLQKYAKAAITLTQLHDLLPTEETRLRHNVFIQSVKAWRLAGEYQRSLETVTRFIRDAQISNAPSNRYDLPSALIERSNIHLASQAPLKAINDLDHILAINKKHSQALLQRANIYISMGETSLAQTDVEQLIRQNPRHPAAQKLLSDIISNRIN